MDRDVAEKMLNDDRPDASVTFDETAKKYKWIYAKPKTETVIEEIKVEFRDDGEYGNQILSTDESSSESEDEDMPGPSRKKTKLNEEKNP